LKVLCHGEGSAGAGPITACFVYEGCRIALFNPCWDRDDDWQIVRVNVRRFDAGFRRGPDYLYIGRDKGRYWLPRFAAMKSGVLAGDGLYPPIVYVDADGTVQFEDGRHRYAALRDVGRRSVPVVMCADRGRMLDDGAICRADAHDLAK
jgi:hypothetical protein